jgi:hypothetical protein
VFAETQNGNTGNFVVDEIPQTFVPLFGIWIGGFHVFSL